MTCLELRNVTKRHGARTALDGVSFSLPSGAALGLLGPNGAGKTTALRLLLGFAQPDAGEVRLQGLHPASPEARRGIGYLPERLVLPAAMTLEGFLRLHGGLAGLVGAALEREIDSVCEQVGVADRRRERLEQLSKGLAQRVGFAQALLGSPRLLLLDEPASGLDPIGIREAREWISAALARGCSLLVSSHLLSEVERVCNRVVILREGRVLAEGPLESVVAPGEGLEDAFVRLVRGGGEAALGGARAD